MSPAAGHDAPAPPPCWTCRAISGCGLILSGVYVGVSARRPLTRGAGISVGVVGQAAFAAGLVALGVFTLLRPQGKAPNKV